jgi:hypothetical protein
MTETKSEAEARAAAIDADKKAAELAEWNNEATRRQRTSEAATAKAEAEATVARNDMWKGLVPDLKDLDLGRTEVTGDGVLLGGSLSLLALEAAAEKIAKAVEGKLVDQSVLVTSELDLAGADAAHHGVSSGVDELNLAADQLLAALGGVQESLALMSLLTVAAQVAPAVLRAASARRTLSVRATTADDLAAATAVMGALLNAKTAPQVWHDDFRLLPADSSIETNLASLTGKKFQLLRLAETLDGAPKETVKSFAAGVDAFLGEIAKVPEGARRSALANARIKEFLHTPQITHVLLVKGVAGSASQLVNDRPFWFKDKFSVLATAGITYVLVEKVTGQAVAAGSASGAGVAHGEIGERLKINEAVQTRGERS